MAQRYGPPNIGVCSHSTVALFPGCMVYCKWSSQACCKAHAKVNRKIENSTPVKS